MSLLEGILICFQIHTLLGGIIFVIFENPANPKLMNICLKKNKTKKIWC